MASLSSAESESHERGLDLFRRLGGNCLHVHGEGGETHSRIALGRWLRKYDLRAEMFVCTQVCHDGWDPMTKRTIDRFTADALYEDIDADLELLETDYLDLVYAANAKDTGIAAFVDAMAKEIQCGRVRAYGVRNWTEAQLRQATDHARRIGAPGPAVVVTTELALPMAAQPLWPDDIPFAQIEDAVRDLGLAVFAHADAYNQGPGLFDDQPVPPRWARRWDRQTNASLVRGLTEIASEKKTTPQELILAWLLNRPFPSLAVVSLPELLAAPEIFTLAAVMPFDSAALARLRGK
ncbi:MAG TPA: aldo/keto reductase [Asticcacaulis sp.]|nr:aldo/keto reductase [Asticcacaulis sp.]